MSALAELNGLERGEVVLDSGLAYGDGEPVEVLVRKRLHRYVLSDRGAPSRRRGSLRAGMKLPRSRACR